MKILLMFALIVCFFVFVEIKKQKLSRESRIRNRTYRKKYADLIDLRDRALIKTTLPPLPTLGPDASRQEINEWMRIKRMQMMQKSGKRKQDWFDDNFLYMHLSALSPTTRKSHAERHGLLYTEKEVDRFFADPKNKEGCKCAVVHVMVDKEGRPVFKDAQDRAFAAYDEMKKRGYDWSK